jgi:OOP family OmpA-OmpF porin
VKDLLGGAWRSPVRVMRFHAAIGKIWRAVQQPGGIVMSIRKLSWSTALLLSLLGGAAHAQTQGWYIGVGAGQSKANNAGSCSDLSGLFDPGFSCTSNDSDTGWKLFGGYAFNRNFALEASYVDLGNFKISASGSITAIPATANGSNKASGFSFDALGTLPITEEFGLIGRIGVFAWTLDATASATAGGNSATVSDKPTGTSLDFGAGVKYDFNNRVGARLEYQRFQSIGNDNTGKSDIDLISASLVYRFQ